MKSKYAIILHDQWDADTTEKDIETKMIVDYDETNTDKPVFIEIQDVDNDAGKVIIGSMPIALSKEQAITLAKALTEMVGEDNG